VGAYLLEQLAGVPTSVYYASEFRYAPPPLAPNTLTVGVTQSGETADTLAALAMEQQRRASHSDPAYRARLLGITNRPESSLGRLVPHLIDIQAGVEVGVAATKTFMGQLLAFYGLAIRLAELRGSRSREELHQLVVELRALPAQLQTPPATSLAAKAGLSAGDRVIGWRSLTNEENVGLGADTFTPVVSWNALRWYLLDSITAHNGFVLQVENVRGGKSAVRFFSEQLPEVSPKAEVFLELGLFPLVTTPPQWFELQLAPVQAVTYAAERVWLITKVSTRMMLGLVTGSTSLAQIGGPLSIADMAGKSAQVGWQPYLAFLALMSISIGLLNLIPLPMLDGGQLLYDAWELVSGRRLPEALQAVLQKSSFILLTFLMLLALFNDFQRYLSP
jgi:membrane-associated protease RseP (regulator of RpoE activity)